MVTWVTIEKFLLLIKVSKIFKEYREGEGILKNRKIDIYLSYYKIMFLNCYFGFSPHKKAKTCFLEFYRKKCGTMFGIS